MAASGGDASRLRLEHVLQFKIPPDTVFLHK